ncbi:MAG: hypothetical protein ACE5NC_12980 [Anaerolineae bacterium]
MSRFVVHMRLARALSKTVRQGSWLARIKILGAVGMLVLGLASVATGFRLAIATLSYLDHLDIGRPAAVIGDGERAAAGAQAPAGSPAGAPRSELSGP